MSQRIANFEFEIAKLKIRNPQSAIRNNLAPCLMLNEILLDYFKN